jgi:hypothetical protein
MIRCGNEGTIPSLNPPGLNVCDCSRFVKSKISLDAVVAQCASNGIARKESVRNFTLDKSSSITTCDGCTG